MEQISRAEQLEHKHSYWKQHIEIWPKTGLTQAEYCQRHNLKHFQLVYWKSALYKLVACRTFGAYCRIQVCLRTAVVPAAENI